MRETSHTTAPILASPVVASSAAGAGILLTIGLLFGLYHVSTGGLSGPHKVPTEFAQLSEHTMTVISPDDSRSLPDAGQPMRDPVRKRTFRCAIYTRKSSEEGLEQDFNSLQAQREACEAYITSQRHEGWKALPAAYDDGAYSGGTMERPALKQLLADVGAGKVDIVVVYKVDRLTRSLMDFAKIVEIFDQQGVSFVSVTQAFNTTSSMGRLTLNVLLSFAQFEREVTGERIRDKIAASKKKGLWMGGFVPLGYRPDQRTLVIHKKEAEIVRTIFKLYCETGSVARVEVELVRRGIRRPKSKAITSGRTYGGRAFTRGEIYKLLSNPVYVGDIGHKGHRYDGQHPAIIDPKTWALARTRLATNSPGHPAAFVWLPFSGNAHDRVSLVIRAQPGRCLMRQIRSYAVDG